MMRAHCDDCHENIPEPADASPEHGDGSRAAGAIFRSRPRKKRLARGLYPRELLEETLGVQPLRLARDLRP